MIYDRKECHLATYMKQVKLYISTPLHLQLHHQIYCIDLCLPSCPRSLLWSHVHLTVTQPLHPTFQPWTLLLLLQVRYQLLSTRGLGWGYAGPKEDDKIYTSGVLRSKEVITSCMSHSTYTDAPDLSSSDTTSSTVKSTIPMWESPALGETVQQAMSFTAYMVIKYWRITKPP